MAKLSIGVGEDFPVEEKPCAEDRGCSGHGDMTLKELEKGGLDASIKQLWHPGTCERCTRGDRGQQGKPAAPAIAASAVSDDGPHSSGGTVRTVHSVKIDRARDRIVVRIAGQGFLHRMVRRTVGTLVEIATGRRDPADITRG